MTRKTSFLTVLIALLVLIVGSSMAQPLRDLSQDDRSGEVSTGPGHGGDDDSLTVLLVGDGASFEIIPGPNGTGPFYIGGTLFDVDTGEELGEFQCWGWFFTPPFGRRMVTQEFNIGDRGTIILAGEENHTLAIVGGTGDFRGAGGESTAELAPGGAGFLIHFSFGDDDDDDDDDDDNNDV